MRYKLSRRDERLRDRMEDRCVYEPPKYTISESWWVVTTVSTYGLPRPVVGPPKQASKRERRRQERARLKKLHEKHIRLQRRRESLRSMYARIARYIERIETEVRHDDGFYEIQREA